jgi:hypothetical protein
VQLIASQPVQRQQRVAVASDAVTQPNALHAALTRVAAMLIPRDTSVANLQQLCLLSWIHAVALLR